MVNKYHLVQKNPNSRNFRKTIRATKLGVVLLESYTKFHANSCNQSRATASQTKQGQNEQNRLTTTWGGITRGAEAEDHLEGDHSREHPTLD